MTVSTRSYSFAAFPVTRQCYPAHIFTILAARTGPRSPLVSVLPRSCGPADVVLQLASVQPKTRCCLTGGFSMEQYD